MAFQTYIATAKEKLNQLPHRSRRIVRFAGITAFAGAALVVPYLETKQLPINEVSDLVDGLIRNK